MSESAVDIKDLKKSFNGKVILNGVTVKIDQGENLVVLGRSGTGKSVLIKCLIGLIHPDEGSVHVLGQDTLAISESQMDELRKEIGFLFQSAALYDSMSVRENLEFPLRRHKLSKDEIAERTREVLDNVGLSDAIDKMPAELSGGMRKRIGLARTLIMRPKIMLYDEPTTGLDPITSREISELILDVQKKYNTASIIITHDMACAKMTADRVVVLKEGAFTTEGTYEEMEKSEDPFIRSFFE